MRIGILGSGLMGGKLGILFARAGHDVVLSYAKSAKKLEQLAREAGGKRGPAPPAKRRRMQTPCCLPSIGCASPMS